MCRPATASTLWRFVQQSTLDAATQQNVVRIFGELQTEYLTPVFEALGGEVSYDELNIMRLVCVCSREKS